MGNIILTLTSVAVSMIGVAAQKYSLSQYGKSTAQNLYSQDIQPPNG